MGHGTSGVGTWEKFAERTVEFPNGGGTNYELWADCSGYMLVLSKIHVTRQIAGGKGTSVYSFGQTYNVVSYCGGVTRKEFDAALLFRYACNYGDNNKTGYDPVASSGLGNPLHLFCEDETGLPITITQTLYGLKF